MQKYSVFTVQALQPISIPILEYNQAKMISGIRYNLTLLGHCISGKIASGVAVRGDSGVAGEGRVVGVPKFHSWGKMLCSCLYILTHTRTRMVSALTNFSGPPIKSEHFH